MAGTESEQSDGFFPRRSRSGRMPDFPPENLVGMYAYDLGTGVYRGKILGASDSGIVLSGKEKIGKKDWKNYFVMENPPASPPEQG